MTDCLLQSLNPVLRNFDFDYAEVSEKFHPYESEFLRWNQIWLLFIDYQSQLYNQLITIAHPEPLAHKGSG